MKKNVLIVIISVIVVIFVFSTGLWIGINFDSLKRYLSNNDRSDISAADDEFNLDAFKEVWDLISGNSLIEKSNEAIIEAGLEGMLSVLDDRYAEYFTAEEYSKIMEAYSGTTSGIGVVVTLNEEGQVLVIRILEDAPAYGAGIMEGDIIVEVDDIEIKDMELENVVAMIKGKEGTGVSLKIFRPSENKILETDVTRARFYIPNLISDIFEEDIGYVWYYDFQVNGATQLDKEIQKLIDDGASGLILDLRNNPGGTWDDAIEVCDLFINEGIISTIEGRNDNKVRTDEFAAREGKYTEIPLVVLINGFSASASELVAGALKDSGRATLVGETSYGKGVIQGLYELSDGSGIKFTTAKYFLPSGTSVEGVGVKPDIMVELKEDDTEDVQLDRAIEEINILISEIE
ncbi:MAG: S41 family peptidase [Actinomycetota bacterium]